MNEQTLDEKYVQSLVHHAVSCLRNAEFILDLVVKHSKESEGKQMLIMVRSNLRAHHNATKALLDLRDRTIDEACVAAPLGGPGGGGKLKVHLSEWSDNVEETEDSVE